MYNDYYLQQIDGKLTITNTNLNTIITNQETIKTNQQTIIDTINYGSVLITSAMLLYVIWFFIVRCFK